MEKSHLIVGLGNPGSKYEMTRHNLGFLVVKAFAQKHGLQFKNEASFQGLLAVGKIVEAQVLLLLPTTYMNLSGIAVRKVADYYKIPCDDERLFLTVVDDVYLKFGKMRLRPKGSAGGHNGLKSLEENLHTQQYARLKMGIGPELEEDLPDGKESFLEDYVLSSFTEAEKKNLPQFLDKGVSVIECWLNQGIEPAIQLVG